MKHKLLCDRCHADKKAFAMYKNPYNNGKCLKCNNHGYILTTDEIKAKQSHINYLENITRAVKGIEIATENELKVITERKEHEQKHRNEYKELYNKLDEVIEEMLQEMNEDQKQEIKERYKLINKQCEATETDEYNSNLFMLNREVVTAKKRKEEALKKLEEAQQFYMFLLQPVE